MLSRLVAGARRVVHDLEPGCYDADAAIEAFDHFVELERYGQAGQAFMTRQIDATGAWKREGHRSLAHFLAARSGTSIGAAAGVVETVRRLDELPATEEAFRAGRLSQAQAGEVSAAAIEAPHAERDLLERAAEDGFAGLKQHAAQVKANALTADEELARCERIHRTRHLRFWQDGDGADRIDGKLSPGAGARFRAAIRAEQELIFREARAEGRREPNEAYAADALIALADRAMLGSGDDARSRPKTTVLVRLDVSAARRGTTEADEVCEIAGVGPISVDTARGMLPEALLKLVITDGVDVLNVTTIGRHRTAAIQAALDWLHPECAVFGCHVHDHLEYHHTDPYRKTGHTKLAELIPLCRHHHHLAEHRGFTLRERPDRQQDLVPPDDPPGDERAPP